MSRRTGEGLRVAVLGLGEAGGRIASDLVTLGVEVHGWDPDPSRRAEGVSRASSAGAAVSRADAVLSVSSAGAALQSARDCVPYLRRGALFADLNSASPQLKVAIADAVGSSGAVFADVAVMAPVPGRGLGTPMLVSGEGAETFARLFGPLGAPVEVVGEAPGEAAERKLLRSVFMKGMAAAALESLHAAEAAGCEEWLRGELVSTLVAADASVLGRLVEGSRRHAARRLDEMHAACELLRALGVEPHIAEATTAVLADLQERARTP